MANWESLIACMIIAGVVLVIIGENRHPVKTLAWCMVLVFLPIIGILLYILFGMDNRHRRLIKDSDLAVLKDRTESIYCKEIASEVPEEYSVLVNMMRQANGAIPLIGNKIETFTEFTPMVDSMIADMEKAEHHIHILFFKFENDPAGQRVADAMIRKAREGVTVRFLYDDAANITVRRRFYDKMRKEGVLVQPFIRILLPFLSRNYNYRNHRKIVVVDGKVAYMGGMNIAQRYADGVHGGVWRDTHIRITGAAVSELQTSFLTDWQFTSGQCPGLDGLYPYNPVSGDSMMQIITGGPMDQWDVIMQGFMRIIAQSRKYVYIQSPYFLPTEPVMRALQNSALGGVDVRVMIPYRGDKGILPPLASRSYVKEALDAGVKIYFYKKGYMHAKTIVCDDDFATIGSTNMDFRSFEQDFEINAFVYDKEFAVQQRDIFLADQEDCVLVDSAQWAKRPFVERFKESFARLFAPLL